MDGSIAAVVVVAMVVAVGAAVFFLKRRASLAATPAATSTSWTIAHSTGMPPTMRASGAEHYFDFPKSPGSVHYVYRAVPGVRVGRTITMTFALTGSGRVVPTQREPPARVRLFLQAKNDDLSGEGASEFKRWWSKDSVALDGEGEFTLSCPVTSESWSGINGQDGAKHGPQFAQCVAELAHSGFTFGGVFAGHGDYVVDGDKRFTLRSFAVT